MAGFDRSAEDVGNVQMLEHVNVTVPDQGVAALFYVTGLGFTRDPYIDFGNFNMWVNLGEQQFHLPQSKAQVLRGHTGVVVPDLEDLKKRLGFVAKPLADTQFAWEEADGYLALTCPWGNQIRAFAPGLFTKMDLGMPYVQLDVPPDTAPGIARFYEQVMGCATEVTDTQARIHIGFNQKLVYAENDAPLPEYDGHHIAIYVADFSGPHRFLDNHGLVTEESDQFQYRFQAIVDPEGDPTQPLFELEHEVRSLSHQMWRRPLVNRNPAVNFFTYRKGTEVFTPA
tara:strand:+ start:231 stop:1082 length:852 start_codon:yes stop_codon:yes gene_type:complete